MGTKKLQLTTFECAEREADIAVLLVDHAEFKEKGRPKIELIVDTKGAWL